MGRKVPLSRYNRALQAQVIGSEGGQLRVVLSFRRMRHYGVVVEYATEAILVELDGLVQTFNGSFA